MNKKIIISSFVGNALEFFDFMLCGVFMMTLSSVFFPSTNSNLSILAGLFAFSAAFYTRPIGALLFGYLGDKYGRKRILSMTVFLMGIPTFVIGILPSYENIGIFAPLTLIACRLLQGLCTGGEYNGAAIFALEHVQKDRPGFVSGLISSSCVVGALSATILGGIFLYDGAPTWFWRVPFLFGALISVMGYYLRRYTFETMEFMKYKQCTQQEHVSFSYEKYINQFIVAISVGALNGALSYTLFGFLNVYMTKFVGFHVLKGIWCNAVGLVAFGLACVVFGALSDRWGEKKSIIYSACLASIIAFPAFYLLMQGQLIPVLAGQILLGIAVGSFISTNHFFLQSLFPVQIRYRAIAFGFCLGMAITGGTTAMLLTYTIMQTQNLYAPAFLIVSYALIFMVSLKLLPKKSEPISKKDHLRAA